MKKAKELYDLILNETEKSISHNRYKTTSFTLLKEDHEAFNSACKKAKRKPSEVLRAMVLAFNKGSLE